MKPALLAFLVLSAPIVSAAGEFPGEVFELGDFERFEASGVTYFAGRLAVVDDTLNSLFLFDTHGGTLESLDSARLPEKRAKFEDVTFHRASKTFFAVGSHEGWTDEDLRRLSVLVEFRLKNVSSIHAQSVRELPLWEGFAKLGLWKPKGMKIEGLAIDPPGKTLYVGLREPADRARVYVVSLASLRAGQPEVSLRLEFDAGFADDTPYCISALTWEPRFGGLLIATSTENESTHAFLGNRLWFAPLRSDAPGEVELVWDGFDPGMKAEGLAVGTGKLFIVYDNDQDDTHIPSRLRVIPIDAIHRAIEPASVVAPD